MYSFSCSLEFRFVCKPILKEIDGFWDLKIFLVSFEFEKFGARASDMEFKLKFTMLESMRTENHNLKRKKNDVDDILGPLLIHDFEMIMLKMMFHFYSSNCLVELH